MNRMLAVVLAGCALACETRSQSDALPADSTNIGSISRDAAADTAWPQPGSGNVAIRRSRAVDFTGDGNAERIQVTATGPRYNALEVAVTITAPAGDTLWHESWPSLLYFVYDEIEGKHDTTVARIVRAHVDTLLSDDKFGDGGLPTPLAHGGDQQETMREAVRYHLAERDARKAAALQPAAPTPPHVHNTINANNIPMARVDAVLAQLAGRPTFMYYAGGEATYAIAWSTREQSFVRIFSCC